MTVANDLAVRRALEAAGVIFIDENIDAGRGVRLKDQRVGTPADESAGGSALRTSQRLQSLVSLRLAQPLDILSRFAIYRFLR